MIQCDFCKKYFDGEIFGTWLPILNICSKKCFISLLLSFPPFEYNEYVEQVFDGKNMPKSKIELNFISFLNENKIPYVYEPFLLKKDKVMYIPDFLINNKLLIEIKSLTMKERLHKALYFSKFLPLVIITEKIIRRLKNE